MTYKRLIHIIEGIARTQPNIRTIVSGNVFDLDKMPDVEYGVFAWQPRQHNGNVNSDYVRYSFTFFYVDREIEGGVNRVDVQSEAFATLDNILRTIDAMTISVEPYTLDGFAQRFTDECAGAYANVTLSVLSDNCADVLGDYNEDYNDDFNN